MLINIISGAHTDILHIQIFPKTKNMNVYYSSLYSDNFNIVTETRAHPVSTIEAKLIVYPDYFNNIGKVPCMFNIANITHL
jgi:hypothetical protein